MSFASLYLTGNTNRWHMNAAMARIGQSNADHQGRCVQLLLMLCPEASPALIRAVAFHDVGEMAAGDLSWPFKQANPKIAAAHAEFEKAARESLCGPDPVLTEFEKAWLRLVDRLESAAYVLTTNPAEFHREASGWDADCLAVLEQANALGIYGPVHAMITDLVEGRW